jgi:hypothetical protein
MEQLLNKTITNHKLMLMIIYNNYFIEVNIKVKGGMMETLEEFEFDFEEEKCREAFIEYNFQLEIGQIINTKPMELNLMGERITPENIDEVLNEARRENGRDQTCQKRNKV